MGWPTRVARGEDRASACSDVTIIDWRTVCVSPSCPPRGLANCCTWSLWVQSSAACCRRHPWPRPRLGSRRHPSRSQRSGGRPSSPCLGASPEQLRPRDREGRLPWCDGHRHRQRLLHAPCRNLGSPPPINVECSSLEKPPFFGRNPRQQIRCAKGFAVQLHQPVPDHQQGRGELSESASRPRSGAVRVLTGDRQFFGLPVGTGGSVTDGYWAPSIGALARRVLPGVRRHRTRRRSTVTLRRARRLPPAVV